MSAQEQDEIDPTEEAETAEGSDLANENEDGEGYANYKDLKEEINHSLADTVDTTAEFLQIFQGKTEFKSWEEFHTLFEKFQKDTGSAFKPKSVTSIEYANERRVRDAIPDHFVYQTVKMVCTHYGVPNPVKKEGLKPRKKYVGRGCEAMVHLRYKGGTLNIVGCNLEHKNHPLFSGTDVIRSVRSFSFSDDIDLLMAKVVMEHNPFANWTSEKEWMALVADLQCRDSRLKTVTVRVVKKRIRFLIDRYMSNSNGKAPLPDDEMGIILYELAKAKQEAADRITKIQKKRGRKRGRPRKYPKPESEDDDEEFVTDFDESFSERKPRYSSPTSSASLPGKEVAVFLGYLERKDDNDRRLKQDDLDLRRRELELHRKQFELRRERFEFERLERQAHLDLLKAQAEVLVSQRTQQQQQHLQQEQKLVYADPKGDGSGVTEYTIVVNNDQAYITQ
ncbi:hypothetical protein EGW08_011127 [Elysia chlorotica]|uniref:ZSWIM3 N-terminal domain-containing protein n=1 Tax=Elysia chlorotica TaxID=188477 RepID=A0A3S0ZRK7_ELYCH|nr:hypothetical protein EGW08_011127 [Elysia chlorotica]